MIFNHFLWPVRNEAAETNTKLCRVGEFLMVATFSTLQAVVQARGNGGGTSTDPHLLLPLYILSIAILLSLASSVLHLGLHCQLRLPLACFFLPLAAFFTAAAVILLIVSSISPSLRWVPFVVFFSTLLFLGCFKLFPAILHYVAAHRRWRFAIFLIGLPADDIDRQSSNNQSPTSMDHEQRVHLHGEISETAAPADQLEKNTANGTQHRLGEMELVSSKNTAAAVKNTASGKKRRARGRRIWQWSSTKWRTEEASERMMAMDEMSSRKSRWGSVPVLPPFRRAWTTAPKVEKVTAIRNSPLRWSSVFVSAASLRTGGRS